MGYLDKEKAIELLTNHDGSEFVVRTKEEDETLQKNILENGVSAKIGDRISEIHSQYDNDIFTITGQKKEPHEKTYEFNKKVLTQLTQEKERLTELKAKFAELEKTKGKGDDNLAKELDQVKTQALKAQEDYEKQIKELQSASTSQQKGYAIDGAIAGMKFNDNIPESVRKSYIEKVRESLITKSEIKEGKLVFMDESGKPVMGKDFELKPVTEMVAENLADILAKDKSGLGLGNDKKDVVSMTLPDHVRDNDSLIAHMKTIPGLTMHSKEWDEMFKNLKAQFKN
jgi:hypothetical protein